MSKLLDKAVGLAASASAVASYLRKKLSEKDDTQIVELYSDEESAKKHANELTEESYVEMTDDSEETTIMNYAPRTTASGVPLVMEKMVDIENDTDDVENLMFSYPLEFEEEEARPAPATVIQAEPDSIPEDDETEREMASDGYDDYEKTEEEPDLSENEEEEEIEEPEEEEYEEEPEEEEEIQEEYPEETEEPEEEIGEPEEEEEETAFPEEPEEEPDEEPEADDFTDVEEPLDEETSLERKLEDRLAQISGIGYRSGVKDAPIEDDIVEPNVDAIMAATRVADETIEEIIHDIENETISAADIDRELGRDPFETMNIEVVNRPEFNNPSYPESDIDVSSFIDEAVSTDMGDDSFVDDIDNQNEEDLADLTRKVVELSNTYQEEPEQPAVSEQPSSVENVLNDDTQDLFQQINNIDLSQLQDMPEIQPYQPPVEPAPVEQAPAEIQPAPVARSEERKYPHLSDRRIEKIREQLESMMDALGGVEKVYLKHYAVFASYGSYWNFKKEAEDLGYEVTDMNEKNEGYMYKEYDAQKSALLQDILTLADRLQANQSSYRGWKVVERSDS